MPALQDVVVALVALAAGVVVARRRFGLRLGATLQADGCEKCASGDPCAPVDAPARAAATHPLKLVRPARR